MIDLLERHKNFNVECLVVEDSRLLTKNEIINILKKYKNFDIFFKLFNRQITHIYATIQLLKEMDAINKFIAQIPSTEKQSEEISSAVVPSEEISSTATQEETIPAASATASQEETIPADDANEEIRSTENQEETVSQDNVDSKKQRINYLSRKAEKDLSSSIDNSEKKESINQILLEINQIKNEYPILKNIQTQKINTIENKFKELE